MRRMDSPADLLEWALSKTCGPWKVDRACGHPPCAEAQRAADIISALRPVDSGEWRLSEQDITFTA